MTHLSSCYFCGVALDEPLHTCELPTPEAARTTTVTLCASCKEKVNVVLEATGRASLGAHSDGQENQDIDHEDSSGMSAGQESTQNTGVTEAAGEMEASDAVGEASPPETESTAERTGVEDGDDGELADTDSEASDSADGTQPPGERETDPDSAETSAGHTEASTGETDQSDTTTDTVVAEDPLSEEDDPFSADAFDDDVDVDIEDQAAETVDDDVFAEEDSLVADAGEDDVETAEFGEEIGEAPTQDEEAGTSTDRSGREHSEESDSTQPEEGGEDDDATGRLAENKAESGADDTETGEGSSETSASQGDTAGETEDSGDESRDSSEDEQTAAKTTISALEYNKVMRMLQNRNFPVNRDEIELVAANAYNLAQSECAQVIDLAVDRGLLDERDGQLYRPEE